MGARILSFSAHWSVTTPELDAAFREIADRPGSPVAAIVVASVPNKGEPVTGYPAAYDFRRIVRAIPIGNDDEISPGTSPAPPGLNLGAPSACVIGAGRPPAQYRLEQGSSNSTAILAGLLAGIWSSPRYAKFSPDEFLAGVVEGRMSTDGAPFKAGLTATLSGRCSVGRRLCPRDGAPLRKRLSSARSAPGSTSMTYIEAPDEQSETSVEKALDRDESSDFSLVEAVAERSELQNQLYLRYRRPLLQVFHHRRIDRDAADDLLQRTFLQAIKKIRTEGLDDPGNLGGYLYRTACKLATAYWRGELSHRHENDRELLTNLKDEALSLEERLDHEQLAKHVRDLMDHLPVQRDREVLERFYLHEEPRTAIRESLQLTDMQFNQVLWRARQRFGDILRKAGLTLGDPNAGQSASAHSTHG